jgi:periplasmic divalent cation tolerance protein
MMVAFLHSLPPDARAATVRQGETAAMRMREGFVVLSSAVGSAARAGEIARALVSARLAACVQVTPVESTYRWQGEVQAEAEVLLQAKTTRPCLAEAEALILRLHDYELPEILVLPVLGGSAAYLDWIEANTRPAQAVGEAEA